MHSEKKDDLSNLKNRLLESIIVMQNDFIKRGIYYGWCMDTLDNLLFLSQSEFGFICELLKKDDGTPYIKSHGITNIAWDEQTRRFYEENKKNGLEFLNFESLWGKAITTGEPVIANDPDNDHRRGGYPKDKGHPKLKSFLGLPIKGTEDRILGVMCVANRPNGYDQKIADFLSPFLRTYGLLIEKYRSDEKSKKLADKNEKLISDLKHNQKALKKSKALLDATGRMASVGGWELDAATLELKWTEEIYRIHEIPFDHKPTLQEAINFFHPEETPQIKKAIERALNHGEAYDLEIRFITAKGKHLWTRTKCKPQTKNGKVEKLLGTFQDITEIKKIEQALRRSEKDLKASQKIAHLGSWRLDLATNQVEWTKELYNMYNFDPTKPPPTLTEHGRLFTPESWERLSASINRTIETGIPYELELKTVKKDGSNGWMWARGETVTNTTGKIVGLWGVAQDITDRKLAEEQRRESFDLLNNLARLVPGVIYQYKLNPDGSSAFPYSSAGMYDIYEVTPEEVREDATVVFGRLHPEDYKRVSEAIFESARTLKTFFCEFRVILPKKGLGWRWSQAYPERTEDGGTLWHGIILDINQRHQVEQEKKELAEKLRQSQKMEAVGRLAGGIAHDFNNMLSVIIGNADIALDEVEPATPLYEKLSEIKKAGKRSADLTRQLLAFARKQTISPKILDLNKVIEGMVRMLQRLIGENINLSWQPSKNLWPIKMDPSQVDQILANLCVNARDAITEVGKVTIKTNNIELDECYCEDHPGFIPGEFVLLEVSDNGCGMTTEIQNNIFEPFFTTKQSGQGTGLGLAMVYGVLKQNNGFINLYSEPGQGTVFKIYIPRYQAESNFLQEEEKNIPMEPGQETILVVEDEPSILKITSEILEVLGYQVVPAGTPAEAIFKAQEYKSEIHLLLTDVVMPEMNGRDLAKNILSIHPSLKLLFMSGYPANIIADHGILDKGVNLIQKPFSRKELAVKLRKILD